MKLHKNRYSYTNVDGGYPCCCKGSPEDHQHKGTEEDCGWHFMLYNILLLCVILEDREHPWRVKGSSLFDIEDKLAQSEEEHHASKKPERDREPEEHCKAWSSEGNDECCYDCQDHNQYVNFVPEWRHVVLVLLIDIDLEADIEQDQANSRNDGTFDPSHIDEGTDEHGDALNNGERNLANQEPVHLSLVIYPLKDRKDA